MIRDDLNIKGERMINIKFSDIKVGDVIAYREGSFRPQLARRVVDRVTATQFKCGSWTFRKKDGMNVGSSYRYAEVWTSEHDKELANQEARNKAAQLLSSIRDRLALRSIRFSIADLEAIDAIIKAREVKE